MLVISGETLGKRMGNALAASWSKSPDGLGPHRFVSRTPRGQIVLAVYERHWRPMPQVKQLVMKGVPEWTAWLTTLQNRGADFALSFDGPVAEGMKRDP
jgi:ABC-type transport system substrate-binding protein